VLVIARYYVSISNDLLEGWRERTTVAISPDRRVTLADNCVSPGPAMVDHDRVAFHCAREQSGGSLLHSVLVFKATGEKLTEIERCRNPK
jgi:hypothetical protein